VWSCSSKPSALVEENVAGRNHLRAMHAVRPAARHIPLLLNWRFRCTPPYGLNARGRFRSQTRRCRERQRERRFLRKIIGFEVHHGGFASAGVRDDNRDTSPTTRKPGPGCQSQAGRSCRARKADGFEWLISHHAGSRGWRREIIRPGDGESHARGGYQCDDANGRRSARK
jgi:hypothetical protein